MVFTFSAELNSPDMFCVVQQQGSAAASEMEAERLKLDCKRALQMVQQWKKMYEDLHQFCVKELLDEGQAKHD